jgi:hypothetical protein
MANIMLAFMAGQELDTGQFITYLFIYALPHLITKLIRQDAKDDTLFKAVLQRQAWTPQERRRPVPRNRVKRYKKPVSIVPEGDKKDTKLRTYLFPLAMASFRVGCHVESLARQFFSRTQAPFHLRALQSLESPSRPSPLLFDSDSFPIGVDNHASRCMADTHHLFEDLILAPEHKKVDGIGEGLEIKGTGTLVLCIQDDSGKTHTICIPNSLYLPELRQCLLSPQHWAQEAKAMGNKGKTWMENYWDKCILCWKGGKFHKTIPFNESTNTPIFYSAPSSKGYRAFVTTFEACKAPYFCREHVLQVPGLRERMSEPNEFIAEENIHLQKEPRQKEVREDDNTVRTSNRSNSSPPIDASTAYEDAIQGHLPLTPPLQGKRKRTRNSPPPTTRSS